MRNIMAVCLKDLKSYFSSFVAYALISVFLVITGFFFFNMTNYFAAVSLQVAQQPAFQGHLNLTEAIMTPLMMNICVVMLFMLPMLTMRSFAEEKKNGTTELLFTYPITDFQIVIGKFTAVAVFFLAMLLPTFLYPFMLKLVGGVVELKMFFSGILGIVLLGTSFLALGMFISSTTENQIVAVSVSFGALLLFWTIGWIGDFVPASGKIFIENISIIGHFQNCAQGLIDTQDILFYALFIFFFLYFTLRILESRNWRG